MSPCIDYCVMSWEMLREWVGDSIKDLDREQLLFQPAEGRNHAWWLFGHIVLSTDIARYMTGASSLNPAEWAALFGMGTSPSKTGQGYPPPEDLTAQFVRNVEAAVQSIRELTDDQLNQSPATLLPEPLREFFGTRGRLISGYAYHCLYHAGQIMMIRKMLGL